MQNIGCARIVHTWLIARCCRWLPKLHGEKYSNANRIKEMPVTAASNKAGIATNEERTKYLRWNRNPYEKGACSESKNGMSNNLVDDSKEKR